jgi:hypothetical protein
MDVILCPLQYDDPPSHHVSLGDISRFIGSSHDSHDIAATAAATPTTTSTPILPVPLLRIIIAYVNDDNPTCRPVSEIAATYNQAK